MQLSIVAIMFKASTVATDCRRTRLYLPGGSLVVGFLVWYWSPTPLYLPLRLFDLRMMPPRYLSWQRQSSHYACLPGMTTYLLVMVITSLLPGARIRQKWSWNGQVDGGDWIFWPFYISSYAASFQPVCPSSLTVSASQFSAQRSILVQLAPKTHSTSNTK